MRERITLYMPDLHLIPAPHMIPWAFRDWSLSAEPVLNTARCKKNPTQPAPAKTSITLPPLQIVDPGLLPYWLSFEVVGFKKKKERDDCILFHLKCFMIIDDLILNHDFILVLFCQFIMILYFFLNMYLK